ncbi:cAMP-independent regulatory protein pac2 [Candida viswanathii]|uniref:cAMP-independent regulatory protein pac2 n=1 Tax=Candida viswanathii TaxID=5486 RepID=A0A367YGA6_9ASCO|nr:cAMP-independent regulatory protein pac2 [Candida viswanathii]
MLIISEFNPQLMQSDDSEEEVDYQFNDPTNLNQVVTYRGKIKSLYDALLIIESCRLQIFPIITRRLTGIERTKFIRPNTIFVWNETQCGMKRWTDGKLWSASKVYNGNFLIYKQLNKKTKKEEPNGLIKQSFSFVTKDNQRYHLISYYENDPSVFNKNNNADMRRIESFESEGEQRRQQDEEEVAIPSQDPRIAQLKLSNTIYPDSLLNTVFKRKNQHHHHQRTNAVAPVNPRQQPSPLSISLPSATTSVYSPIDRNSYSPSLESTYSTSTVATTSVSTPKSSVFTPLTSIARCVESKNLNDSLLPPPAASNLNLNLMKDYDMSTVRVLNKGGWLK